MRWIADLGEDLSIDPQRRSLVAFDIVVESSEGGEYAIMVARDSMLLGD